MVWMEPDLVGRVRRVDPVDRRSVPLQLDAVDADVGGGRVALAEPGPGVAGERGERAVFGLASAMAARIAAKSSKNWRS